VAPVAAGRTGDESPGHGRRQEGVTGGGHLRQQEAAGAGAQRVVPVLVEVERGQDDDPRSGSGGRRGRRDPAGRLDAVMIGIRTSMSTTSGRSARHIRTEAARRRRPGRQRSTDHGRALAHADEAMTGGPVRPRAGSVVAPAQPQSVAFRDARRIDPRRSIR
jgi:hypothetical protein